MRSGNPPCPRSPLTPAGLKDCVSGLRWVVANPTQLNMDPAPTVVAGDSGGRNLSLADDGTRLDERSVARLVQELPTTFRFGLCVALRVTRQLGCQS
jgi:hypothetical protein